MITRRRALQVLSIIPVVGFAGAMPRIARAAEFSLKYGNGSAMFLYLRAPLRAMLNRLNRLVPKQCGTVRKVLLPKDPLGGEKHSW